MKLNEKIRGSLIGGAIGDALGYPIEFDIYTEENKQTRYYRYGIISDDTQLSLFTANAILWRETRASMKGIAPTLSDAMFFAYLDWYDTQRKTDVGKNISWIKNLDELRFNRAPGMTCMSSLTTRIKGTIESPLNQSKGCGGVMRVAPIGMYFKNVEEASRIGAEASAITHGHALGIIPAYVFTALINLLVHTDLSLEDALNQALDLYDKKFDIFPNKDKDEFLKLISKAIKLSREDIADNIAIKKIGAGWTADEALAIAIYSSLKYQDDFKDAIVCAVNHDGDSDSTGSITGNIMGAYLGYSKIPKYYIENLELNDVILELADDLSIPIPVSEYGTDNDPYWLSKYVTCTRDTTLKEKARQKEKK